MKLLNYPKFLIGILIFPCMGYANMPVIDFSNLTQNSITAIKTTEMLTQQLKQIQFEIDNLKSYASNPTWQASLTRELFELSNIAEQVITLSKSMQTAAAQFNQQYPGFRPADSYPQQYQSLSTNTMNIFQETLQNVGVALKGMQSEQSTLQALHNLNNSPQGHLQAIQTGNNLVALATQQTIQLRQLISNQTRAENAYLTYQVQKDQTAEASVASWVNSGDTQWPTYRNQGFGPYNYRDIHH